MEKYLYYDLAKLSLLTELDIVLAYKRARQFCEVTGIMETSQTKFATAVAEICRNVLEHVGEGTIIFNLAEVDGKPMLEALVTDRGRGINQVEQLLARKLASTLEKGSGILNSRKLVDGFRIDTHPDRGTKVYLQKKSTPTAPSHQRHDRTGLETVFCLRSHGGFTLRRTQKTKHPHVGGHGRVAAEKHSD